MNPLEEQENRSERLVKQIKRVEADELARERQKVDLEFSRLPVWKQAVEAGDRLQDGSDEQTYEPDWQED